MQRKKFFLAVVLLIGSSRFLLAYAVGMAVAEQSEDYREPRSERARVSEEQRRLYGQCLSLAEVARKRGQAFLASVRRGHFESDEVRQHLKKVSLAVEKMLQVHDRFLKSLTEEQWNRGEAEITELERLRAALHAQLQGMDYELQMPKPQANVLANYAKNIDEDLANWRTLYRKIGAVTGIEANKSNERSTRSQT